MAVISVIGWAYSPTYLIHGLYGVLMGSKLSKEKIAALIKARAAKKPKPEHLKTKSTAVTLTPGHKAILKQIGAGNISKGIRKLIEIYITKL